MRFMNVLFDLLLDLFGPVEESASESHRVECSDYDDPDLFDDPFGTDSTGHHEVVRSRRDDASTRASAINPANGLPMVDGEGGVDVAGNPYGFDDSSLDSGCGLSGWGSSSGFDDGIGGCDSGFDSDSFGCGGGFNDW